MADTIATLLAAHAAGKRPTATIEETFSRIAYHADPALFITLRPEADALAAAAALEQQGREGKPLFGVPFVVKDNIDVAGIPTTAACPAFAYTPKRSAFVVEKLERAGAIVIGKTNLDQFATGLVGTRSPYGVPRNALRADLIPGGSSSGSATAVASGIVPFALGTDTAGSGRVPAALNGIVGLKPSLGTLSTTGVVPACRTLDTVSIFALDVADAMAVFHAAAGYDVHDAYSKPLAAAPLSAAPKSFRVGAPRIDQREFFGDAAAAEAFRRDLSQLEALGARVVEFDFAPFAETAKLLYEGPWVAERYAATKMIIESNPAALNVVTRAIIEGARKFDAVDVFKALYALADKRRETLPVWADCDLLAVPTIPRPYTIAEVDADPVRLNSRLGMYTNFVNLLDLAAIACPSGMRSDGLPSSLTLIAPAGRDGLIAGVAASLQARSGAPMGATGLSAPHAPRGPAPVKEGQIAIAVVGAHLSGLPLNGELIDVGATFLTEATTTADYCLYELAGSYPAKPGLLRVVDGAGRPIAVEVWTLDAAGFGAFVAKIPPPLGIGTIRLADGTSVKGFLVEAESVVSAKDITKFGGWRAYLEAARPR